MLDSLVGRLLVAQPDLGDPNFRGTVTLLCAHGPEGAFGLVLNRALGVPVAEVLPAWADLATEPGALFSGGPVEPETAFGLGLAPRGEVGDPIVGPLRLLDLGAVPPPGGGPQRLRVFTGYAGWSAGQVEAELLGGGWKLVDATAADPFTAHPERLWEEAFARPRSRVATVPLIPGTPHAN